MSDTSKIWERAKFAGGTTCPITHPTQSEFRKKIGYFEIIFLEILTLTPLLFILKSLNLSFCHFWSQLSKKQSFICPLENLLRMPMNHR
jgi:hypothetical protein